MNFNNHSDLSGLHAFLSPSNYHWVNYNPSKLESVYRNQRAKEKGILLHDFASVAISNKIKLANHKKALNLFVNDSIGYRMESEVVLFYSDNAFGTADAIRFKDDVLMIFDLKTGHGRTSFKQLDIYAALFCLEYGHDPLKITIEERIYQHNGYTVNVPIPEEIASNMETIVLFDKQINEIKTTLV